jgi:hypothetical protein
MGLGVRHSPGLEVEDPALSLTLARTPPRMRRLKGGCQAGYGQECQKASNRRAAEIDGGWTRTVHERASLDSIQYRIEGRHGLESASLYRHENHRLLLRTCGSERMLTAPI